MRLEDRGRESAFSSQPEQVEFVQCFPLAWECFAWCTRRRPYWGMGGAPGAIPTTEIEAWLRLNEVDDPEDVRFYLIVLEEMDQAYTEWLSKSKPSSSETIGGKSPEEFQEQERAHPRQDSAEVKPDA